MSLVKLPELKVIIDFPSFKAVTFPLFESTFITESSETFHFISALGIILLFWSLSTAFKKLEAPISNFKLEGVTSIDVGVCSSPSTLSS